MPSPLRSQRCWTWASPVPSARGRPASLTAGSSWVDEEREDFAVLMRELKPFPGLRVFTYVVMSNHFHLLVEEPDRGEPPDLDRETLLVTPLLSLRPLHRRYSARRARPCRRQGRAAVGAINHRAVPATHGGCLHFHERAEAALKRKSSGGGFATRSTADYLAVPPLSRMSLRVTAGVSARSAGPESGECGKPIRKTSAFYGT